MNKRLFDPEDDIPDSSVEAIVLSITCSSQLRLLWQTLWLGLVAGELAQFGWLNVAGLPLCCVWLLLAALEHVRWRRTITVGLARLHAVTESDYPPELEDELDTPQPEARTKIGGADPLRVTAADFDCVRRESGFRPIQESTD